MGERVKSLAEIKADNIHCFPLIYSASHSITADYQTGQALFPLGESMLTTTDNLLLFHTLRDDMQDELLHLSRMEVLLLALSEVTLAFLRHLCCSP